MSLFRITLSRQVDKLLLTTMSLIGPAFHFFFSSQISIRAVLCFICISDKSHDLHSKKQEIAYYKLEENKFIRRHISRVYIFENFSQQTLVTTYKPVSQSKIQANWLIPILWEASWEKISNNISSKFWKEEKKFCMYNYRLCTYNIRIKM